MVSSFPDGFMATADESNKPGPRPSPLRPQSLARSERKDTRASPEPPRRAHTFQNGTPIGAPSRTVSARVPPMDHPLSPDTFESTDPDDGLDPPRASVDMDELPIELVSLTDR